MKEANPNQDIRPGIEKRSKAVLQRQHGDFKPNLPQFMYFIFSGVLN